jgi:hypothetical protein
VALKERNPSPDNRRAGRGLIFDSLFTLLPVFLVVTEELAATKRGLADSSPASALASTRATIGNINDIKSPIKGQLSALSFLTVVAGSKII